MGFRIGRKYGSHSYPSAQPSTMVIARNSAVLWDSSQPSLGNRVRTWAEVMSFVSGAETPTIVYVVGVNTVPAGAWNMMRSIFSSTTNDSQGSSVNIVDLANGAVLHNLTGLSGDVALRGNSASGPCLTYDYSAFSEASFTMRGQGIIKNLGSAPMIEVPPTGFIFELNLIEGASMFSGVIAHVGDHSQMFVNVSANPNGGPIGNNTVTGGATASLEYNTDGTAFFQMPTFAGFAGTVSLDLVTGVGVPTAGRPINPSTGCSVFDENLGKPIWWKQSAGIWVLADGTPA